jgi:hypothetical protein
MNQYNLNEGAPKALSAEPGQDPHAQAGGKPAGRWPFQARLHPATSQDCAAQSLPRDVVNGFVT